MSFFRRIDLNYRPKPYIQSNLFTKQYVYNSDLYIGTSSGSDATEVTYYFEFNYNKIDQSDFLSKLRTALTNEGVSLTNINFNVIQINTYFIGVINSINSSIATTSTDYRIAKLNIEKIVDLIKNVFTFTFLDENGETVVGEAKLTLETDNYHQKIYRYNTVYKWTPEFNTSIASSMRLKFINASDSSATIMRSNDKVYIQDASGNYMQADLADDLKTYNSATFLFSSSTKTDKTILFEIHGYDREECSLIDLIATNNPIPNDYGFKIELLPPSISSLFDGLSSLDPDYEFTADSSFNYIDADPDNFNTSVYYSIELGTNPPNDPDIPDIIYNIDECWLTFDGTSYGHSYDNDYPLSKVFYNGTSV
jgi:hypothetical protein